jgi:hypothetical protein
MPHQAVVEAAKLACIHDDIVAMPMGYETLLVDGGASLSGGQQQRIALARALAHRPTILLLDEATSDLDGVTERMVHRNLSALGCTRIVIAHRLSTIVDADLILVMEDGRIVQQGTHDELMLVPGAYRQQVTAQLRSTSPDAPSESVQLWHLVTDAPAAPMVDKPGPDAAETPVATRKGPDAAKAPGVDAAKAPAANGQGPAPAKPSGPNEAGPGTATPIRDRGRADWGDRGRVERADHDQAAAQAAWTWLGRRHRLRPAPSQAPPTTEAPGTPAPAAEPTAEGLPAPEPAVAQGVPTATAAAAPPATAAAAPPATETKVSPAGKVQMRPAREAEVPPAPKPVKAVAAVPPAGEAKKPPAPEVKEPPPKAPPGPEVKARPAAEAKMPPAAEVKAPPAAQPKTPAAAQPKPKAPPAAEAKVPPARAARPAGPPRGAPAAATEARPVPEPRPPGAPPETRSEATAARPAPANEKPPAPSAALARGSQATPRESDSMGESGRSSESMTDQPKVADRAGALARKALTSSSAGSVPTAATRRPIPGMAMPSTPPAGPSPLRRLAKQLGRKKAAAGGMPAPAAPVPPAEPQVLLSAAKDAPAPAATATPAANEQPAAGATDRQSNQDKRSHRAWNLRRFTSSRRPETPEPKAPATRAAAVGAKIDHLGQSIETVIQAVGGQSPNFCERDLPQIAASEIATRVRADVIVLLLDNGQGIMEVSGAVGLDQAERQLRVEYSRGIMRELFRAGVGLVEDTDRFRGALAGIPGSRAETLIMVPLAHERLGFGVLIAGRGRGRTGTPAEVFTNTDVEALMGFADGVAPSLRTAVVLRHLRGQLSALEDG